MRKSKVQKARLQKLYKECVASGGHQPVLVDKHIGQERCIKCDYCVSRN